MKIMMNDKIKILKSEDYNYFFNLKNGIFLRWGKNKEDDPEYSKYGPEILDIEISTICSKACSWCYKSNTAKGKYMSLETFKQLFAKFPKTLTQIAFGIGDLDGNPDMFAIMRHCRANRVIPNVTINGEQSPSDFASYYEELSKLCGAVAVSHYGDNDKCGNAIQALVEQDMKQVNIHKLLCKETYNECFQLIRDTKNKALFKGLNAIVFLWLKPKGNRNTFTQLDSLADYKKLVDYAFEQEINIGFDSCSAPNFLKAIKEKVNYKQLETMVEPCESTLFSYYINVDGIGYPCSFTEGQADYKGVNILESKDFLKDVWYNEETKMFRHRVTNNKDCNNCRNCPEFNLEVS